MEIEQTDEELGAVDTLSVDAWTMRERTHIDALEPFVNAHLERRHRGEKHPVHDFLFEYFNFRPAALMRWSPGVARYLQGDDAQRFCDRKEFSHGRFGVGLYPETFLEKRVRATEWILNLQEAVQARPPFIGCMGLHEWAMVFEPQDVRHPQFSLRMPHDELVAFVREQPIRCTHFDAFRFFSTSAVPLNRLKPTSDDREVMEQPGCLHANMDLYKWTYKLYPWTSGELLRDAFDLAVETRSVDMRASPYDLRTLGYEPICIETREGQDRYATYQQDIYRKGKQVRGRLIDELTRLLNLVK